MRVLSILALLSTAAVMAWVSCDGNSAAKSGGTTKAIHHDFGIIRHGLSKDHTFEIPLPEAAEEVIPVTYWGDCPCASGVVMIQDRDGRNRVVTALARPDARVRKGEKVLLRVNLDTANQEPVSVKLQPARAKVIFESLRSSNPRQYEVPLTFDWGIKAPVRLEPVAAVAVGDLPRSKPFVQPIELHCDMPGLDLKVGPVHVSNKLVTARLIEKTQTTPYILEITVRAQPRHRPGAFRTVVLVDTNVPNDAARSDFYQLPIEVTGSLVSDIEVLPSPHLEFGIMDFAKPRKDEVFVNVTDHDSSRPCGFVLEGIRSNNGIDLRKHFAVRFEKISDRTTRVWVKYLGGVEGNWLRGELSLAKNEGGPSVVLLTFRGYNRTG